jgi:hypothetical protein
MAVSKKSATIELSHDLTPSVHSSFLNPSCSRTVVVYPICDSPMQNSAWNMWKSTRKFWNWEAPSFTNFLVKTWTRSSLATDGRQLRSSSWTFVRPSLNILHHCLTVPALITLIVNRRWWDYQLEAHHKSLSRRQSKQKVASYVMVYKAISHVTLPPMCKIFPAPTLVAKDKWTLLSE